MSGYMVNGRANTRGFQFMVTLRALEMEVQTGMRMSRISALAAAQNNFGVKAKTKKGAIKEMRAMQDQYAFEVETF